MKSKLQFIPIALVIIFFNSTSKIFFSKDPNSGTVAFTITVAPYFFEEEDVKSFTFYDVSIAFKVLGSVKVEMNLVGKTSLTIQAPDYLVRRFFLDESSDIFLRILNIKL